MRLSLLCVLTILFGLTSGWATPSMAQPPDLPELRQLIVRLAPESTGAPAARAVYQAVNEPSNPVVPGNLGEGSPSRARLFQRRPPSGRLLELIRQNPSSPSAKISRTISLYYGNNQANLDGIANALRANRFVEHVEKDRYLRVHGGSAGARRTNTPVATTKDVTIKDSLVGIPSSTPDDAQWSLHLMKVLDALQYGLGTASIGILDAGIQLTHPDLRLYTTDYLGEEMLGPFRAHLSEDIVHDDCFVDELGIEDGIPGRSFAGHGTFTAGSAVALANGRGSIGTCPGCSLHIIKVVEQSRLDWTTAGTGLGRLIRDGVQVVSMSFGEDQTPCQAGDDRNMCIEIAVAEGRDIMIVASAGNDRKPRIEFPANSVIGVGGLEWVDGNGQPQAVLWDDAPNCPFGTDRECGSNFGPYLEFMAAARTVIATMYEGFDQSYDCGDVTLFDPGWGYCSGTSLSAPTLAGVVALIRSINPLLRSEDVMDILVSTSSGGGTWSQQLGYGYPNVGAAVLKALGTVGGEVLPNRLTPLFGLFGKSDNPDPDTNPDFMKAETFVYTTVPSMAVAFLLDAVDPFVTVGPLIPWYGAFPGIGEMPTANEAPKASIYLFTSDREPFPGAPPLVPIYRVRYDPDIFAVCDPTVENVPHRDFAYTTTLDGVRAFKEDIVDENGIGYDLDKVIGYLFKWCGNEPGCVPPPGTVTVYRAYHRERDDYAIFTEDERVAMEAAGYDEFRTPLGYSYAHVDSDGDTLIDGWEILIGTDPAVADTDCDGISDGAEVLLYDRSNHGYGDPLTGPCSPVVFTDGFESGDALKWSAIEP